MANNNSDKLGFVPTLVCGENAIYLSDVTNCMCYHGIDNATIYQGDEFDISEDVFFKNDQGDYLEWTVTPDVFDTCEVGEHTFVYEANGETFIRIVDVLETEAPVIYGASLPLDYCNDLAEPSITFDPLDGVSAIGGSGYSVEVVAELQEPKTVLYNDGTLIINELPVNRQANIDRHGTVRNEWFPLDSAHPYIYGSGYGIPWTSVSISIEYVEIGSPIHPTDTHLWFSNAALNGCDFTGMDTSQVTNMSGMFYDDGHYGQMEALDLSMFDTSNVTDMSQMFRGRTSLKSIDLSSFNTSNVTDMGGMFIECTALESLDLGRFDTSNVTDFRGMFHWCYSLADIYGIEDFDTSKATSFRNMFTYCESLTELNLMAWNTENVNGLDSMFAHCSSLETLWLCGWNPTNFSDATYMFSGCSALTTIYSDSWVSDSQLPVFAIAMWSGCSNLVGGAGTTWDSEHIDWTSYAKVDGGSSDKGYFTECQYV